MSTPCDCRQGWKDFVVITAWLAACGGCVVVGCFTHRPHIAEQSTGLEGKSIEAKSFIVKWKLMDDTDTYSISAATEMRFMLFVGL